MKSRYSTSTRLNLEAFEERCNPADIQPFAYGAAGWLPVAGDWDGDGTDTIGVVDPLVRGDDPSPDRIALMG